MERYVKDIDHFTRQVQTRLNRHLWWGLLIRWLTLGGAVLVLAGVIYVRRGVQVPWFWYPLVLGAVVVLAGVDWCWRRHSHGQAARFLDHHFRLQDAVRSYLGFHRAHHDQGFYALQARQTAGLLHEKSPHSIPFCWPKGWVAMGVVLLLASLLMGSKPDSLLVRQQKEQAVLLLTQTEELKHELQESVEEVLAELSELELPAGMDPNALREWVDELMPTGNLEEAHRQVARLEQQLNQMQASLQQRYDEQLLDRIGQDLQEAEQTRALGEMLTQRQYRRSAEEIETFKIDPQASQAQQQRQSQRLQQLAGRMSEESRSQRSRSQKTSESRLGENIEQLQQASQQMSQAQQRNQQENSESSCQACQQGAQQANQSLGDMAQQLQRMGTRREVQQALQRFSQELSRGQGKLGQQMGQGNQPGHEKGHGQGEGKQPGGDGSGIGGQEAGSGTGQNRESHPQDIEGGTQTQLNGIHGQGPSDVATEQADSGDGAQNLRQTQQERLFRHQAESFIQREDVPSAVKAGVKTYFKNIHTREDPPQP